MKYRHCDSIPFIICAALIGCGAGTQTPAKSGQPGQAAGSQGSSAQPAQAESSAVERAQAGDQGAGESGVTTGLQTLEHRSVSLTYDLNLSQHGQGKGVQSGEWSFEEERTLRVKKAVKDRIMELEVVYGKWEAKPLLGLTYEVPTDGKTYLVAMGDKLTISRGQNEKLSPAEDKLVNSEYGWVGGPSPLHKALLDARLEPGAKLSSSSQIALTLLGAIPGADVARAGLIATIKSVADKPRKTATLEIGTTFRISSKKTAVDLELKGTGEIDVATGWVQALDLAGTATVSGQTEVPKKGAMDVEGAGKVTLKRSSELR
jgi:hypothetical protein